MRFGRKRWNFKGKSDETFCSRFIEIRDPFAEIYGTLEAGEIDQVFAIGE